MGSITRPLPIAQIFSGCRIPGDEKPEIPFEYPKNYKSRNVNNRGFLNYKGKRYFIGNPFNGYNMGIQIDRNGQLNVWFGNNLLGYFDKESLLLVPEKNDIFKPRKKRKVLPMS